MAIGTLARNQTKGLQVRPSLNLSKKIAVQFTPEMFARVNEFANENRMSFAAAARMLISSGLSHIDCGQ